MKTLILMRHAKSDWDDPTLEDIERPLNRRGRMSAGALGEWLETGGHRPERVLLSSAVRTQETWARVATQLSDEADVLVLEALYLAPEERMLEQLRRKGGDADVVMMICHNPGTAALAERLLETPIREMALAQFPTGATAIIDFDVQDWREVGPALGRLQDFIVPRALLET